MASLPTVDEVLRSAMSKVAASADPLPSEVHDKLMKLAGALRDLPDEEPTMADVYTVKEAICGQ